MKADAPGEPKPVKFRFEHIGPVADAELELGDPTGPSRSGGEDPRGNVQERHDQDVHRNVGASRRIGA